MAETKTTKRGLTVAKATKQEFKRVWSFVHAMENLFDSRSFFSYARHEYFRRILCNVIGKWVENGEYPDDMNALGGLVQDICYNNAKAYFGM